MSYSRLYAHAQGCADHISRRELILKAAELSGLGRVVLFHSDLDPTLLRGMYLEAGGDSRFSRLAKGRPAIVIARDQSEEWQRFVTIKELMHVFDQPLARVGTPEDFSSLVDGLTSPPSGDVSDALLSEGLALFMALGVVCQELRRQGFVRRVKSGELTAAQVAHELRIPVPYVHHLLGAHFKPTIRFILDRDD